MEVRRGLVGIAFSAAKGAHEFPDQLFLEEQTPTEAIFSFPGTWSGKDNWCSEGAFGETEIDSAYFPSLRSIGNNERALVNKAFQERFKLVLQNSRLRSRVEEAVVQHKPIVFTGHSSGAPIAVLATIWCLEEWAKKKPQRRVEPLCLTFGSPLIGSHIFSHALRRENWSCYFLHLVTRYDIVPRIFLTPLSSKEVEFRQMLDFFKSQSMPTNLGSHGLPISTYDFFIYVMSGALTLTSHVACKLMESSNLLFETVTSFIKLSPYRPFGTYIFSNGDGKHVTLKNADAVLQLLFYSCQPSSEVEKIAKRSFTEHFAYENELLQSLNLPIFLDSGVESTEKCNEMINDAADKMGLSTRGRLCLLAAGESESQKRKNKEKMESKKEQIERALKDIENYKNKCAAHKVGYYDSFKLQNHEEDFKANVKRLELAGIVDEMIEMLKGYKLPDQFEGLKEWIVIGTRYRCLVEPLDIANYYRHSKNEDTGEYMKYGRPKRYRYTQRWREHAENMPKESSGESCFWAEVEELRTLMEKKREEQIEAEFEQRAKVVQNNVFRWGRDKVIQEDVFFSDSTFVTWWKSLPSPIKLEEIKQLLSG